MRETRAVALAGCSMCALVVIHLVILACGIGLITVGSLAEVSMKKYLGSEGPHLHAYAICIITLGVLITLLALCGVCNPLLYCVLLVIYINVGLSIGIAGFVIKSKVGYYT
ncbi:hypothetical protein CRM22_005722, partial [Opisthorchis felineus]